MAQNKLKKKVEALTNIVKHLITEIQTNATMAQGTLTAFQLYIGEDEWNRVLEELKDKDKRQVEQKEKKLEIPKEK